MRVASYHKLCVSLIVSLIGPIHMEVHSVVVFLEVPGRGLSCDLGILDGMVYWCSTVLPGQHSQVHRTASFPFISISLYMIFLTLSFDAK
jgi:hypothetical protein